MFKVVKAARAYKRDQSTVFRLHLWEERVNIDGSHRLYEPCEWLLLFCFFPPITELLNNFITNLSLNEPFTDCYRDIAFLTVFKFNSMYLEGLVHSFRALKYIKPKPKPKPLSVWGIFSHGKNWLVRRRWWSVPVDAQTFNRCLAASACAPFILNLLGETHEAYGPWPWPDCMYFLFPLSPAELALCDPAVKLEPDVVPCGSGPHLEHDIEVFFI